MELLTPRLRLRSFVAEDFPAYEALWADPVVTRFIGGVPFTREQSWTRFLRAFGMWQVMGFGFLAVTDRETGAFLGEAGFHEVRRALKPPLEGTMETGWGLTPPATGRGLATEAVGALISWAATTHPGRRLTCLIDHENVASRAVAAKVGFRPFVETDYHGRPVTLFEQTPA